jgi:hypothetical protein
MTRARSLFGGLSWRECAAMTVLLFMAVIGISIAVSQEFPWYARLGGVVGFAGPLTAHLLYALVRK